MKEPVMFRSDGRMEERFEAVLRQWVTQPENKKFLLAISGGVDSTVMADLFHRLHLHFDMAHCNFHLRGEESNNDMRAVQQLAEQLNVKLYIKEFDTLFLQADSGKSIEMVARDLRYNWFASFVPDYDYIVTAHHANDNAETVLLHLTRGTGLKGLRGIPPQNGNIIRPLLPFSSTEIRTYAAQHQLSFCTDSSNESLCYQRNKIRHLVIPVLEQINPQFISICNRNIELFHRQYDLYEYALAEMKRQLLQIDGEKIVIPIEKLVNHPFAQLLLYDILQEYNFSSLFAEQFFEDLGHLDTGKQFFSSSHQLLINRHQLIIVPLEKIAHSFRVTLNSEDDFSTYGFNVQKLKCNDQLTFTSSPDVLYLDAEQVDYPFVLRNWERGDSFRPFGMQGRKKLSNYFNDEKIDRITKNNIMLLCKEDKILWIVGYRASNEYPVDIKRTQYYFKITYHGKSESKY